MSKFKKYSGKAFSVFLLLVGAAIMLGPFIWTISTSIQGPGKAYQLPPEFFKPPFHFDNYLKVWQEGNFADYTFNSALVTALCIVGVVLADSFAGYGFAKYESKLSNTLFLIAITTMYIPSTILAVPQYTMWTKVGALDTYIPLVLPKFLGSIGGIFLMRQSFKALPNQFYEAATIDGLHPIRIFFQIYLPLVKPMLATLAIQTFIGTWNETFAPLIYLTDREKYTLSVGLLYLRQNYSENLELLMSASMLTMLPLFVVYLFAQKYFMNGLVSSGIKG